jgi:renalase
VEKIAIIGAGIAGLACAQVLSQAGHSVRVFDKGRGPGGRMSTRRVMTDVGEASFDHGAQYFTARDGAFTEQLQTWIAAGFVGQWQAKTVRITANGVVSALSQDPIFVGIPGMNGLIRGLGVGLNIEWSMRVEQIKKSSDVWCLMSDAGEKLGEFDQIVCAVPAEQVAPLIAEFAPSIVHHASSIKSLPCWTGLFAFDAPLDLGFDAAKFEGHEVLDFISVTASKPMRAGPPTYVVQANAAWSIQNLERSAEEVSAILYNALLGLARNSSTSLHQSAHRWRYARVEVKTGPTYLYEEKAKVGACGDWLQGPRVEAAWLSGHRLGKAMSEA